MNALDPWRSEIGIRGLSREDNLGRSEVNE